MDELFEDDDSGGDRVNGGNAPEFSVSEISGAVRRLIEGEFANVRVRGEIGRVSRPASGHIYLDLKDDRSVLASVCWKGVARTLATQPEEGMEVIATGRLTTFGGQSKYQLVIESLAPAGVGALMAMLEKRRQMLAGEGLFDADRKRPIPYLPEVIGVITSPSGAVIRDIIHRLRDRCPRHVLIWPVAVQGEQCAPQVAAAINGFNALDGSGPVPRPDVLIIARGGGSVEDLWGFNDEAVVRAAAAGTIPLISAVGHETDTTLVDHVADLRAPTPSAAAELAVPVRTDLLAAIQAMEERRSRALVRALGDRRQRVRDLSRALPRPDALVGDRAQRLDEVSVRLAYALGIRVSRSRIAMADSPAGRFSPGVLNEGVRRKRDRIASLSDRLRAASLRRDAERAQQSLAGLSDRLVRVMTQNVDVEGTRLAQAARLLDGFSHDNTLRRGFAIVRSTSGTIVADAAHAGEENALELEFRDGRVRVGTARARRASAPKDTDSDGQGQLF